MQDHYQIRINFKGGIAAPAEMQKILLLAKKNQVFEVRFGLRQQMIFHVLQAFGMRFIEALNLIKIDFQVDENSHPNIVSSYVSEEVFQTGNWLTEGIYKDILDGFDFMPKLKINISDSQQSFTPFFSGHLNFISSQTSNFWYLYVRMPKTNRVFCYSKLIFSTEIAGISRFLENQILVEENNQEQDVDLLFSKVPSFISLAIEQPLILPKFTLPYYEGFNRYGSKSWLGIYRRNEVFSIDFLLEIGQLCQDTSIGQICLTPFKSLIIKGIQEKYRDEWSKILLKNNINVRHAANELNWQVEDDSPEALALKLDLVKAFDKQDLRSFGLCFGIKTKEKTEVYASIMVRQRRFKLFGIIPTIKVYDLSYTEDFNPNGRTKVYFAKAIVAANLPEQLRRNVLLFNKLSSENKVLEAGMKDNYEPLETIEPSSTIVHQCPVCYTIYDADFGDILNNIEAGIPFKNLSQNYCCPTCETSKKEFKQVSKMEVFYPKTIVE